MSNTEKFTGRVSAYVAYRERYDPEIVLPILRDSCSLKPGWTIADIGAGTGMLSDIFLANGNRVLAIEPNAEMREACLELHPANSALSIINGTAEATGLPDASVEAVAVGRALHWFDLEATILEFRRILKPSGWVIIIAFGRSKEGREENIAYEDFLRPYTRDGEGTRVSYAVYQRLKDLFPNGEFHQKDIPGEMSLDWQSLRGLTLSLSHAPLPGTPEFAPFEASLIRYFDKYQHNGKVTLTTRYWINAARFAPLS
ncbi:SAM-dependent methyltransferase [Granulicella aggregans]|uniref:SAM-dependent methyltransferase n=1 Tax=Granulicella aggregans TaxID=474949 RepID=A0A7W7ZBB2_9BACT|nr:class I SAM-dependent methyltransferase [Granulicella aggregans]MBB5056730.1 SAM-dependent methyltransferase [Granulicella aggregans]